VRYAQEAISADQVTVSAHQHHHPGAQLSSIQELVLDPDLDGTVIHFPGEETWLAEVVVVFVHEACRCSD